MLTVLSERPTGPFEMADEQGRRLVNHFPGYLSPALYALRDAGVIELLDVPCLCGHRGHEAKRCFCPLGAWRLPAPPPRSNVIEAAHRFRRTG